MVYKKTNKLDLFPLLQLIIIDSNWLKGRYWENDCAHSFDWLKTLSSTHLDLMLIFGLRLM